MKILVAGGEGYLGSIVCNMLCDDHDVTSVDIGLFKTELNRKVRTIRENIFDIHDLSGFEVVIFLAGLSNDPMSEFDPPNCFAQNIGSVFHLAKIAKRSHCRRLIYASSCSVYGWQDAELYETDSPKTESYYGISKYLGEVAIEQLSDDKFNVCVFRMGTLSGHSPRMRFDLMINAMYRSCINDNCVIVNDPYIWRPILDVRDAARAYKLAVDSETPLNGIYNLAYGNYQINEIASFISDFTGCAVNITGGKDVRNYRVNTDKIRKMFDFNYSPIDTIHDLFSRKYNDVNSDIFFNIKAYMDRKL